MIGGKTWRGWTMSDKKLCMCPQELCNLSDLRGDDCLVHPWNDSCDYCNSFCSLPLQQCLVIVLSHLVLTVTEHIYCASSSSFCWREKVKTRQAEDACINLWGRLLRCSLCCIYLHSDWRKRRSIWQMIKRLLISLFYRSIHRSRWLISKLDVSYLGVFSAVYKLLLH